VFVTDLVLGTELDADVCFYPDGLRVLIVDRHAPAEPVTAVAGARPTGEALREYAAALAADPWLERWPMVLAGVIPARAGGHRWCLLPAGASVDAGGAGLARPAGLAGAHSSAPGGVPVDPAVGAPWRLVAASGGRPVTVAGEWTAAGLRPLSVWLRGGLVRL
jgi:hypothetical protein